jgi:hypothetical protein
VGSIPRLSLQSLSGAREPPHCPNLHFFLRADDYSKNLKNPSRKALLLVYVTIGNAAKYTSNETSLTRPPVGFDSVQPTSLPPSPSPVTVFRLLASLALQVL